MNTKKLILTSLSVFCFGASLLAQNNHNKQSYKDELGDDDHVVAMKPKEVCLYSRDVVSLAPLQFSENGLGIGLAWEHTLDREGYLSFELPVAFTMNPTRRGQDGHNDMMYYALPGLKFYPTGLGRVKYALGPTAVIGTGEKTLEHYDPYHSSYIYSDRESHFVLGMLINNSLNINPTARLHISLDFGMGFSYLNQVAAVNDGMIFLTQGSFKIGYRF